MPKKQIFSVQKNRFQTFCIFENGHFLMSKNVLFELHKTFESLKKFFLC